MYDNARRRELYEKKKSEGKCVQCGKQPEPGSVTCEACKAKSPSQKRYYENKAKGLCRSCGADAGGKSKCEACKEKQKKFSGEWYHQNIAKGVCGSCAKNPIQIGKSTCQICNKKNVIRDRAKRRELKSEVFAAYGGPKCVGCGEDDAEILEVDHIDGGGCKHLKEIGRSQLYPWLKKNSFPAGFRILCPTCNKKAHKGRLTISTSV